ncbi:hypothetical protein [Streptomyces sp. NPDC046197]|uniref:hypothetical protein n=1 Tax=Streptomyces sp. NPDC046197 TaxID=3154337 RepID=UPI003402CEA0
MARSMVDGPAGRFVRGRGVTVRCRTHSAIVSPDTGTAVRPCSVHKAANASWSVPYARHARLDGGDGLGGELPVAVGVNGHLCPGRSVVHQLRVDDLGGRQGGQPSARCAHVVLPHV